MQEQDVNTIIGRNIRIRRSLLGFSQSELAKRLGITFQQVQKYEKGANTVAPAKLKLLSQLFVCSIDALFDDPAAGKSGAALPVPSRKAIHLVENFERIRSENVRKQICDLVRLLAGENDGGQHGI